MPANISLPAFLEDKLRDAAYNHVVVKAVSDFSDWFRRSNMPFFPDYTDHGIQHIEQVLTTAANLIPDHAREYFTGADAAALVLSVLFHDSALHLSPEGVKQLIKDVHSPYLPVAPFDQKNWAQTWEDFMFLARRWDDTKLVQVFGSGEVEGVPAATVRDPFAHWTNLTRTDHLLIGEFIRQQHPRLAHEMALHGVPGVNGALLKLDAALPEDWRDLVGLIARSHGLPLRTCLDYLKNSPDFGEGARREYQGVHAVYLMALLRVADYIQIQGDRTSNRLFHYRKIYSPVSTVEHQVHQSVRNITNTTDDPEALFVQAKPGEVSVFLRLKEWLAGIQQELDGSWAVLGEVYGRDDKLRNLGLTFRRVRSNLDNVAEFAKTVPYVPDRIRFDVARAELLKLLIGPLYGDDPSYGVRELMQNAIDAVREYDQFVLDNPQYKDVPRREQEADVVVELGLFDEVAGYAVMTIADRGIGMKESVIRDYFLKAGASYRQNADWKVAFESDGLLSIKSKIIRSGRFGVGALASFLIGEEVMIETRHAVEKEGYQFRVSLNNEAIELKKIIDSSVGTVVKILVSLKNYHKLTNANNKTKRPAFFDWYRLDYPSLQRKVYEGKVQYQFTYGAQRRFSTDLENTEWRKLMIDESYQVYWAYNGAPAIICNGFFVSNSEMLKRVSVKSHKNGIVRSSSTPFDLPSLFIIDPDGNFPLNLQRDGMSEAEYPFELNLVRDVLQEMLAWVFFQGPFGLELPLKPEVFLHDSRSYLGAEAIVMKSDGYAIRLASLLSDYPLRHLVMLVNSELVIKMIDSCDAYTLVFIGPLNSDHDIRLDMSIRAKDGKKKPPVKLRQVIYDEDYEGDRIDFINPLDSGDANFKNKKKLQVVSHSGPWVVAETRGCDKSKFIVANWPAKKTKYPWSYYDEGISGLHVEEQFLPDGCQLKIKSQPWLLDDIWNEYFGSSWLPFDLRDRLTKFPSVADFLSKRYPQVVPELAWNILGIERPTKGVKLLHHSHDEIKVPLDYEPPF